VPTNSGAPASQLMTPSVQLASGASANIPVLFQANNVFPGAYDGYISIQSTQSPYARHVPFWYAVASGTPAYITILDNLGDDSPQTAGSRIAQAVTFRITDAVGLPLPGLQPSLSVISPADARVSNLTSIDGSVPGAYVFDVRLSTTPGGNVFQIQIGAVVTSVTITGQ